MLVRSVFVVGVLLVTLLGESPPRVHALGEERCTRGGLFCTDENGHYTLSRYGWTVTGVVWLDENQDGVRQPDEPVAPYEYIWLAHKSETLVVFYTFYREKVNEYGDSNEAPHGCAAVGTRGATELIVDIRAVWPTGQLEDSNNPPLDWPLADGHFFKQKSSSSSKWCDAGFSVTNSDGIPFWDAWQRLGVENVGYPISHRYVWRGFITQAFEKVIVQWQPGKGIYFINIFDELHDAGKDDVLRSRYAAPRQLDPSFDYGALVEHLEDFSADVHWRLIAERRLALLDDNPAIKERYYANPAPLLFYGLPTSRVEDMGNHYAISTERRVLKQWKEDVPWAKAGEVTIANLRSRYAAPRQLDPSFDAGALVEHWEDFPADAHWQLIKERRLALLDANPAIKERYYAASDPLLLYGLPTSRVEDMGDHYAIRSQRTVLKQWKEDVPWAKAGEVTIANSGEIARDEASTCEIRGNIQYCTYWFFPPSPPNTQMWPQHVDLVDQGG